MSGKDAAFFGTLGRDEEAKTSKSGKSYMLTKIPGVIDKRDVIPGMAYFANTGPVGTVCFDCAFFTGDHKYGKGRCLKFAELIAGQKRGGAAAPSFSANAASCRYFEPSRRRTIQLAFFRARKELRKCLQCSDRAIVQ